MKKLTAAFISCLTLYGVGATAPAKADVITTFDITGEVGSPPPQLIPYFPISGSVTINTTIGNVVGQTIVQGSVRISQGYSSQAQAFFIDILLPIPGPPDPSCLGCYPLVDDIIYFNTTSLAGYAGGTLGSFATPTAGGAVSLFSSNGVGAILLAGTATPEAIPEPSSTAVLALGIAGVAVCRLRRRFKHQA